MKRKKIVLSIVLVVTHLGVFLVGSTIGAMNGKKAYSIASFRENEHVLLSNYVYYRDIALGIKSGDVNRARCLAELNASVAIDGLHYCLADSGCADQLTQNARKLAPEVLGEAPLPFTAKKSCP